MAGCSVLPAGAAAPANNRPQSFPALSVYILPASARAWEDRAAGWCAATL